MDGKRLRKTFRGELQYAADAEGVWSVNHEKCSEACVLGYLDCRMPSIARTGGGKRE